MKKYTYSDSKWVLLGMIVPILMFFFAMNSVYAYFTATATPQSASVSTGIIKLEFSEGINATQNSVAVVDGAIIYPGQSFNFAGTIKNSGNASLYAILVWDVVLVDGDSEEVLLTEYYTPAGVKLTKNLDNTYSSAQEMAKNATQSFSLNYDFDFNEIGNDYQGKTVKFVFNARGIQTANISLSEATQRLVNMDV